MSTLASEAVCCKLPPKFCLNPQGTPLSTASRKYSSEKQSLHLLRNINERELWSVPGSRAKNNWSLHKFKYRCCSTEEPLNRWVYWELDKPTWSNPKKLNGNHHFPVPNVPSSAESLWESSGSTNTNPTSSRLDMADLLARLSNCYSFRPNTPFSSAWNRHLALGLRSGHWSERIQHPRRLSLLLLDRNNLPRRSYRRKSGEILLLDCICRAVSHREMEETSARN